MVDLDWGVETNGEEVDSSMNDFRFDELYRCHSLSAGPNFVVSWQYSLYFKLRLGHYPLKLYYKIYRFTLLL